LESVLAAVTEAVKAAVAIIPAAATVRGVQNVHLQKRP
jgi:hypothetical protein